MCVCVCVCVSLCTTTVHSTEQFDNVLSYPADSDHSSDDVYWRVGAHRQFFNHQICNVALFLKPNN